ncbi:MAG: hypothetical protein AAGA18_08530 [Verrucomicrobiota bacterium]
MKSTVNKKKSNNPIGLLYLGIFFLLTGIAMVSIQEPFAISHAGGKYMPSATEVITSNSKIFYGILLGGCGVFCTSLYFCVLHSIKKDEEY